MYSRELAHVGWYIRWLYEKEGFQERLSVRVDGVFDLALGALAWWLWG